MNIPWQFLGTLSALSLILILLGVYLGHKTIDVLEQRVTKLFASALAKQELLYSKQIEVGAQVDLDLRNKREAVYKALWSYMRVLPMWPRAEHLTYAELEKLSVSFRDWYFDGGGIYLSAEARKVYGELQEALNSELDGIGKTSVTDPDYDMLVERCRALRAELTKDLLSRTRLPRMTG